MAEELPVQEAPPEQEGGGGDPQQLVDLINKGLAALSQMLIQSGNEEAGQEMQAVAEHFASTIEAVMGGGGAEKAPRSVPTETGGKPARQAF